MREKRKRRQWKEEIVLDGSATPAAHEPRWMQEDGSKRSERGR